MSLIQEYNFVCSGYGLQGKCTFDYLIYIFFQVKIYVYILILNWYEFFLSYPYFYERMGIFILMFVFFF